MKLKYSTHEIDSKIPNVKLKTYLIKQKYRKLK